MVQETFAILMAAKQHLVVVKIPVFGIRHTNVGMLLKVPVAVMVTGVVVPSRVTALNLTVLVAWMEQDPVHVTEPCVHVQIDAKIRQTNVGAHQVAVAITIAIVEQPATITLVVLNRVHVEDQVVGSVETTVMVQYVMKTLAH
jgi:hypothetical protein